MAIGLGTAALGRPQYINIRQGNFKNLNLNSFKKQGLQLLEEAYNLGVRYFDTAPGYGLAEGLLLEWLQTKKNWNAHHTAGVGCDRAGKNARAAVPTPRNKSQNSFIDVEVIVPGELSTAQPSSISTPATHMLVTWTE